MQKAAYKTKQQDLLFSYLKEMQGKHFTAEDVRTHFEEKKLSIGIATIYRQLEKLVAEGKIQKYSCTEPDSILSAGKPCRFYKGSSGNQ